MICSTLSLSRYHDNSLRFNWFIIRFHQRTKIFAKFFSDSLIYYLSYLQSGEKVDKRSSVELSVNYFLFLKLSFFGLTPANVELLQVN